MRQSGPFARTKTAGGRVPLTDRFADAGAREWWGYGTWLFVGLVFGIPETWSGVANPPWPSLSNTIAHLETRWPVTRLVVVAIIVFVVFNVLRYPAGHTGEFATRPGQPKRWRTSSGRLRSDPAEPSPIPAIVYFSAALAVVALGSTIAALTSNDMFVLGYVLYGLFAIFAIIVPNVLAYWFAREVPFPPFFRTISDLEHRWHPAAMVIVAALVVLLLHLIFFPWPVLGAGFG